MWWKHVRRVLCTQPAPHRQHQPPPPAAPAERRPAPRPPRAPLCLQFRHPTHARSSPELCYPHVCVRTQVVQVHVYGSGVGQYSRRSRRNCGRSRRNAAAAAARQRGSGGGGSNRRHWRSIGADRDAQYGSRFCGHVTGFRLLGRALVDVGKTVRGFNHSPGGFGVGVGGNMC